MGFNLRQGLGSVVAALFVLGALVLNRFIVQDPEMAEGMARGLATPLTWPRVMLAGIALCALGWCVQEGWRAFHAARKRRGTAQEVAQGEALEGGDVGFEHEDEAVPGLPIALGLALAVAYAFVIPWLGFTVATVLFLLLWFLVGGIRRPVQLVSVALIGTLVLLFIFVKLALMPLDRGAGVFGEFTIALFRLLGFH